jgi:hypothetical protein
MVESQLQETYPPSAHKREWADQSWDNTTGGPPDTACTLGNKWDQDHSIPPNVAKSYDQTLPSQWQQ